MSFKPIQSLIDQPTIMVTESRGFSKMGPADASPSESVGAKSSKLQFPSQIITVSNFQDLLQGKVTAASSKQSIPLTVINRQNKHVETGGTYAKRQQMKQKQYQLLQQQQLSQQHQLLTLQGPSSSLILGSRSSLQRLEDETFEEERDLKPFALQLDHEEIGGGEGGTFNGNLQYVTVMEASRNAEKDLKPIKMKEATVDASSSFLAQSSANSLFFQDSLPGNDKSNAETVFLEDVGDDSQLAQIVYQDNLENAQLQPTVAATSLTNDGGALFASDGRLEVASINFDAAVDSTIEMEEASPLDVKVATAPELRFQSPPGESADEQIKGSTTVMIPSTIPGGQPQRLVIPTSTWLQITGATPTASSSSKPQPIAPKSPLPASSKSASLRTTSSSTFSAPLTVLSPTKNGANFIVVQKPNSLSGVVGGGGGGAFPPINLHDIPAAPKPKSVRFVPITAAPVHSAENSRSQDSFELNGLPSPNRDGSNRLPSPTLGISPSDAGISRPRKPCNCTKSQCLKLYCDCFANGEFCFGCNCTNCYNNLQHEEMRQRAIKSCLDRNPFAFHPKIGKSKSNGNETRRHAKGCNCRKSSCLKNYCECYEAKIPCTAHCKCVGCKNYDEDDDEETSSGGGVLVSRDSGTVEAIPVSRFLPQANNPDGPLSSVPARPRPFAENGQRQPFSLISQDVVEAAMSCMLSRCERVERHHSTRPTTTREDELEAEACVMEELGRSLRQIINAAAKSSFGPS